MKSTKFILSLFLFSIINHQFALAWWDQGHETIAQIAELQLTEKSREMVKQILHYPLSSIGSADLSQKTNQVVTAAPWADYLKQPLFLKNSKPGLYGSHCHFLDVSVYPEELTHFEQNQASLRERLMAASSGPERSSLSCSRGFIRTLRDPHASPEDQGIALRYLIHIIGDIHQPLHNFSVYGNSSGHSHNSGGSKLNIPMIQIPYLNLGYGLTSDPVQSLHFLWDSTLGGTPQIPYKKFLNPKDLNKIGIESELAAISASANELIKMLPVDSPEVDENPTLEEWAFEGLRLGVQVAYNGLDLNYSNFPFNTRFFNQTEYLSRGQPIALHQIAVAGYRLGKLINAIFDPALAPPRYQELVNQISTKQEEPKTTDGEDSVDIALLLAVEDDNF